MKTKCDKIFLFGFIISVSLTSCSKENMGDCFKSAGELKSKEVSIAGYHEIEVHDNVNILLIPDSVEKVKITAGENLLPFIIVEAEDGKLLIGNRNKCNWVRSFKTRIDVEVHIIRLDDINHYGSGEIKSADTIFTSELSCNVRGSGNIELLLNAETTYSNIHAGVGDVILSGKSGVSYVYAAGSGFIRNNYLRTGYTFLNNKGTGDCFINVELELVAEIKHTGNVYYTGMPLQLFSEITGKGKLIKQ